MQVSRIIRSLVAGAMRAALAVAMGVVAVSSGVRAAAPSGLYSATVPLVDASPAGLREAYRVALRRVLVKLTGRATAGEDPALASRFGDPERIVQQFRREAQSLEVQFDRDILRRGLTAAGYGLIGDDRPVTLVWLGWEGPGGERGIVYAADPAGLTSSASVPLRGDLLQAAESRALPVQLPAAGDHALSPADLWADSLERIRVASRRYGTDAILVGRGQGTVFRWTLLQGDDRFDWQGAIADGPLQLAERLADRLAPASSAVQTVQLSVSGVRNADQYGLVLGYLQGLDVVERLDVTRATGETIGFILQVRGGASRLERALAARRIVQPGSASAASTRGPGVLEYSLPSAP